MPRGSQFRAHPDPRTVPSARPTPSLRAIRFALLALVLALALGGVVLWSAPAEAQTATVLISNAGQTAEGTASQLTTSLPKHAQAFTTGTYANGYTLDSIDFDFGDIGDITTAGAHLTVTLNGDSSGNPGTAPLCTLTDPATFSGSGVQTFDAPATDPCPTLTASTTYFAVIERVVFPTPDSSISLNVTTSGNEDAGGATGWSIGDTSHWFTTFWNSTGLQSHQIEVKGLTVPTNAAPAFSADAATRTLPENSGAGVNVVGGVITATDSDSGDTLTYSLTGTDAGTFEIDSNGQIKTKTGVTHTFNFEAATNSYSVTVNVSDSKDVAGVADTVIDDTIAVTIDLTNVDEAGTVTLPATFTGGTEATASVTDPDGTVSSESWRWARGDTATGSFSNISGATSASYEPIALDVGKYLRATVNYTDPEGSGKTASAVSSSTVGGSNAAPTFDDGASTTRSFPENSGTGTNVGGVVAATDGDSDTLTYSMTGNIRFNINTSTGQIKTASGQSWNYEGTRNFQVTVNVRDSKDAAGNADTATDDTIAVTINLTNVNEAPEITTTATTASVVENSTAVRTLAASDVDASDTPTWSVDPADDGGKFEISSTGLLSFKNAPNFEEPTDVGDTAMNNTYVVTVKVTDNGGLSDTLTFTVTVTDVNEAPEITTGPATIAKDENTQTTEVIATYEAEDMDVNSRFTWDLQGVDAGDFTITKNADGHGELKFKRVPNFEIPADDGANNGYDFTVRVRDGGGLSDTIPVTVTVTNVNEAPVITTPDTTVQKNENETHVILVSAMDVDMPDTLNWSVETDDDGGKFEINQTTGAFTTLSFKNAPDFEEPRDVGETAMNNTYVVTMKVTDAGGLSDTLTVTVTVTDVNETPTISFPISSTITEDENTATTEIIATYVATDPDATTGTMSWDLQGNDAGDFTITSTVNGTVNLYFAAPPNFEGPADTGTNNVYDVTVRVRDNGSPRLQDTQGVAITVQDVNETPVISGDNSPDFAEIEYDETSAVLTIGAYSATDDEGDSVTWAVSGTDATHFSVNSTTGELSFSIQPDFENPADMASNNMYEIVLEAEDDNAQGGKTGTKTGTYNVIVTVTNVDETPEITTAASSHTAPSFMEIEYDATTADLVVADYDGRDEEGQTISWSTTGTDTGDFTIDGTTGVLSFAQRPNFEMPADGDADNVYNITVRARDTASNTRELAVVVTVTDVNERPDIDEDTVPSYVEIQYDFTGTRPDVHTFTAEDYDAGDTFAWSLLGTDAAYLEIGATTGILTFTQDSGFGHGPLPSFEHPRDDEGDGSSNTYSITVRATDDDATDQKFTDYAVVVTVTDVNEVPEFTGTPETAITPDEHDANDNYVVMDLADYDARDEEGGVTWSLTGTDRLDFAISADGVVTFAETPNYEEPEDSGGDNVYEFTVVATDVQSGSSRRSVSIGVMVTVGDVEEDGTLTVDNLSPAVSQTLTFRLTDPDGGIDLTLDNLGSPINWRLESRAPGGSWEQVHGLSIPVSTTFPYTVDEDFTGKALRAVVTYVDRRGTGKMAVSEGTAEVTPDPIANAPPRFRGGATWNVEEGAADRAIGPRITATDRDNDGLTFGIQSSLNSDLFEINPSTGQVRAVAALDFETMPGPLRFRVTLHDGRDADGNAEDPPVIDADRIISVFVTDVEEDGVVTFSAEEAETGTPLAATLEDGDGGVTGQEWLWARSENGRTGWTNISGATSSSYTPTVADEDFFLRATVTYTDRRGAGKSAEGITGRRVPSENRSPVFPSTEDGQRTVPENTRVGGNIGAPVAAVDPENNRLTYTLTGTDADAFTVVRSSGQIRTSEALDFETKPSYSLTVEVHDGRDGAGNTSTDIDDTQAVTITVENVEEPGTVTLTTDTGTIQARVEVTATLEDDDGPSGIGWQWARSLNGRTDWVNIAGATSATYTPTLEEDRGNYIRAIASYGDGHGPNKTANTVSPRVGDPPPVNAAPVFPATENGRREVEENATAGTAVGVPVEATDLNAGNSAVNDPLAYSLSGTDAASFTIDSSTGQIRLAQDATLDYEGKRTYRVTVEVTDGRDQNGDDDMDAIDDRQNVTITVTNVNEAPVVTGDDAPSFQEHSSAAIATYAGADPERDTITWSVSVDDFWISSRGRLYFRTPPSFEAGQTYTVTVTATDDDETANLSGTLAVTVTVTDAEEEGVVAISPARGWVDVPTVFTADLADDDGGITGTTWQWERSPNGRSSWTDISAATSGSYTVTAGDANQYLRASASYEDRRGGNKTASAALTAPVGDARPATNTAPEFTEDDDDTDTGRSTTRSVSAGASAGRNVGAPVRATDTDQGDVLTYSLSGTDAELFDIDPATGQIRTRDVLVYNPDPLAQNTYTVTVSVHDGFDGAYIPSDAPDATIDVTITVTAVPVARPPRPRPPSNQPPVFVDGPRTDREVAENAAAGENVGPPVVATDSGILTFTLGGADAGYFGIVAATGQIQVGDGTILDHEAEKNTYGVEVTATDRPGATAVITVTIAVTNLDEAGTVVLSSDEPTVGDELTATLGDPDGGVTDVTWQWAKSADMDSWTDISGATSMSYTPASMDAGYHLRATATYTDLLGSGKTARAVSGYAMTAVDPLVSRYDANVNGMIDKAEVIQAINDYLVDEGDEAISKAEVIRLINLYLFG